MALARHNLTRRALLGAGVGAPLAVRGQLLVTVPNSSSAWHRALLRFRRAEARLAAFRRWEAALPAEARAFPACEPLEAQFGDLDSSRLAALRRLLRTPAPDLAALSLKIDLTIDDQAWELAGASPCLAALKADAWRLAANSSA